VQKQKKIIVICALGVATVLCTSCAPVVIDIVRSTTPTSVVEGTPSPTNHVVTETSVPATATTRPTETATATPEAGIDMEKFQNMPANYEYLLAHLDEFVQAPDPLTDRAAFNRWWDEELIPALGPISQRPLTANTLDMVDSRFSYSAIAALRPIPLIGKPNFFYFENNGVIYPVPCINVTNSSFPGVTRLTLCPALTDRVARSRAGTNSLEMFSEGAEIVITEVYQDLSYKPDVDWGGLDNLVNSLGGYYNDPDNRVIFGFGTVVFDRK